MCEHTTSAGAMAAVVKVMDVGAASLRELAMGAAAMTTMAGTKAAVVKVMTAMGVRAASLHALAVWAAAARLHSGFGKIAV